MLKKFLKLIKNALLTIILSILSIIILIFLFDFLMGIIVHSKKTVVVPDLYKVKLVDAIKILKDKKLYIKLEKEQYESKISPGCVISQSPTFGTIVRVGKVIKVISSKGGETVAVPNLKGMEQRLAEIKTRNLGLIIGQEKEIYSLSIKKGYIAKQDPLPDEIVPKASIVNFVISKGHPPSHINLMPNFIGKKLEEVELEVENLDYIGRLYLQYKVDENYKEEGIVIDQTPVLDTILKRKKTNIKLVVTEKP